MPNARPHVRLSPVLDQLKPYAPPCHRAPCDLKLDANEGVAPSPELLALEPGGSSHSRYPKPAVLEAIIAARHGVRPEQVLVTAGVDEALHRVCQMTLFPGRNAILPVPTFEMLPRYIAAAGAERIDIAWLSGAFPLDQVKAAYNQQTSLAFVVSPNNPTGATIAASDLDQLARFAPDVVVAVDLAYAEFADEDLGAVALEHPNALVFRTLSKAWGLAGLRIGYVMGDPMLIERMRAVGSPYPVSGHSLMVAGQALDGRCDAHVARSVARVRAERAELYDTLRDLGLEAQPSQGNFVLARTPRATWLRDGLAGLGIAIRLFQDTPQLEHCVRITCPGNKTSFQRVTTALHTVLKPQALLFDMDGVLADVSGSYRKAILLTCSAFGVHREPEDVVAAKAQGNANNDWELSLRLIRQGGKEASLDAVIAVFEGIYHGSQGNTGLKASESLLVDATWLRRLSQRLPLGIVTGRPRRDAHEFLQRFGIAECFSAVVCMEDGKLKPSPEPVQIALQRLGLVRAWMIGDTVDDVAAARGAGVLPLGIVAPEDGRSDMARRLVDAGAARVLSKVEQIQELLA